MMLTNPIISFVIPAYNIESYLGRMLDSIFNQILDDGVLEILVVDDCSADGTVRVAEKYKVCHRCMRIIRLEKNSGVSTARNVGLSYALGEYVWFVDGDDVIAPNAINIVCAAIENLKHPDILAIGHKTFSNSDGSAIWTSVTNDSVTNPRLIDIKDQLSFRRVFYLYTGTLISWNAIYRRAMVKSLSFRPYRNGEDVLWGVETLLSAKSIGAINNVCYGYYLRSNSACRSYNEQQLESSLSATVELIDMVRSSEWDVDDILLKKIQTILMNVTMYKCVKSLGRRGHEIWTRKAREIYIQRKLLAGWRYELMSCLLFIDSQTLFWIFCFFPVIVKGKILRCPLARRLNAWKNTRLVRKR